MIFVTIIGAIFLFHTGRTALGIFSIWPGHEAEVQFVWQKALTDAAAYLETLPQGADVAVGGWTPETMDPPTMELTLRRSDLHLRFFNPQDALLIPAGTAESSSYLVRPSQLPFAPLLAAQLEAWPAVHMMQRDSFTAYTVRRLPTLQPELPARIYFGQELLFLGHTFGEACLADAEQPCHLLTYWQVTATPPAPRRFFLHVLDELGETVDDGDGNGAPAAYWVEGDLIVQQHEITLPAGAVELRLGVYDPLDGPRLPIATGQDYIVLDRP